ncbi:MAG: alpha-L-rhamnosidase C-terminal domain-containing protein [Bacteroidota bacterium]
MTIFADRVQSRWDGRVSGRQQLYVLLRLVLLACWGGAGGLFLYGQSPATLPPTQPWEAHWISHPTASLLDYGVFLFRKKIALSAVPDSFPVHVSADSRYRLWVNGARVAEGPAKGDLRNWRYETLDLSPYLDSGQNLLAAEVWNFGPERPVAQISAKTAFLMQGGDSLTQMVNTGPAWKVWQNQAYSPIPLSEARLRAYLVVGAGEKVAGNAYPWNWQDADFSDAAWPEARRLSRAFPKGTGTGTPWMLVPRTIPFMKRETIRWDKVRETDFSSLSDTFLQGVAPLVLPPDTTVTAILDHGHLTTAYPILWVSGGQDARIQLTYAESLSSPGEGAPHLRKGHRDEIEGKAMFGYRDEFYPDGGKNRRFSPLWYRTYRYVEIQLSTGSDSLWVHDLLAEESHYPFEEKASFHSKGKKFQDIWEVGWRTARLCAHETYVDCPYYEQLQYVGDTRIQALISLYVSGDDRLMRKAILDFDLSRSAEGLVQSRYPSSVEQYIPPYALFWISMVHDYWMHRPDSAFVQQCLPGMRAVLSWYRGYMGESGMLERHPWWNFVDWAWPWDPEQSVGGVPPLAEGRSSILSLQLAYVLGQATELEAALGDADRSRDYGAWQTQLSQFTFHHCWDIPKGYMADNPTKNSVSQHANVLAILTDAIPPFQQADLMEKILADTSMTPCTFYYQFYLHRALVKTGLGDRYIDRLKPWRDMLDMGLTTFAEKPEPTRSDCHAWSASPNYELLATIAGITPAKPGFKEVRIAPHLGKLKEVKAHMPHPQGTIRVELYRRGKKGISGYVELPQGVTGEFSYRGYRKTLKAGRQRVFF